MALASNFHEMANIAKFCRENSRDYFRFDPFLHLRFDLNQTRNREIMAERLSPQKIVCLEQQDPIRFEALKKTCNESLNPTPDHSANNHLFRCGAGNGSFILGYNGLLRLCSALCHPDCVYDLRSGSLSDAWSNFIPQIVDMRSDSDDFKTRCRSCALINLCMWCPAHAHLETGVLDRPVDYFCEVAHARAAALKT
jgi:radical SAM protein with 4Fe4S-binding SPASM domain